ncbi:hypothetical protein LOD99_6875 [Oopsacas minuta]|uniref:BHLH domain-containing protein n=1 Tax=Oopsacas minuta TaxID=111878 RepID=A0AAV7JJ56_9METZ|nr:hypothetical protein LOD99_6875 [Oopsacas minuta]
MRREFIHSFGRYTISKSVFLSEAYRRLIGDVSATPPVEEEEVNSRVFTLLETEDPDLIWDFRIQNTGRPESYTVFLEECKRYLETSIEIAVDEHRHDAVDNGEVVTHLAHAFSMRDMFDQVCKRCPEGTPLPSIQWFSVKKYGELDCGICKVPCLSKDIFCNIHHLPDLIPHYAKYKDFEDVYGSQTSEEHRPFLLCHRPKHCGSTLADLEGEEDLIQRSVFVKANLTCNTLIEIPYFTAGYGSICYCYGDDNELQTGLKYLICLSYLRKIVECLQIRLMQLEEQVTAQQRILHPFFEHFRNPLSSSPKSNTTADSVSPVPSSKRFCNHSNSNNPRITEGPLPCGLSNSNTLIPISLPLPIQSPPISLRYSSDHKRRFGIKSMLEQLEAKLPKNSVDGTRLSNASLLLRAAEFAKSLRSKVS